jgi:phosphohistidine phosphatase
MTIGAEGDRRRLVLLRHAKSAWPDMPDHERPLARRGQRDAPVMGRWLRAVGLVPDLVLCSTALRARETWQLAQSGLGAVPSVRFDDRVYEASPTALLDLIRPESGAAETLLVVGHDPGSRDSPLPWRGRARPPIRAARLARCPPGCSTACGPSSRPQRSRCSAALGTGMA